MNILLYSPDNGVTRNFMPHLWMFLLKSLTPPEHEVFLIDGNAQPMTENEIAHFVRAHNIRLVGISAMTRMAARAYKMDDAIRATGAKVVFGGPHVTEVPDEPLGRAGEPRHADAIALGEADYIWPQIVNDAATGNLKEIYRPVDANGKEAKPTLADYPEIPWETLRLEQFNLVGKLPHVVRALLKRRTKSWETLYVLPMESGRGCPYGCEFCTVTGFFGDVIRFRSNQSVIAELHRLKQRAQSERGTLGIFFVDGIFAITSFIFGMDGDTPGVAKRTAEVMDTWPPGLPVFSLLTPFPSTPLYQRLLKAGRLERPKHWLDSSLFTMSFTPENITQAQAEAEVREAWTRAYSPKATTEALRRISNRPLSERIVLFFARLAFRGIYFPQMTVRQWVVLLLKNRRPVLSFCYEAAIRNRMKP